MNDHNLDDLIIDNISPKNSKTKSFLTLIALAIVMLIIAIILTKIILKDPQSKSSNIDENSVYISPDLTLQPMDSNEEIVKAPLIPTTEEVKPEINIPTHTIDDVAIETEKRKSLEAQVEKAQKEIERNKAEEAQKEIERNKAEEAQKEIERNKAEEIQEEIERNTAAEKEKSIAEAKAKAEQKQKKTTKRTEEPVKKSVQKEHITHPYFIQVGSFSKAPSTRFLSVIRKSGFHYQIATSPNSRNKKLLIGPYDTKTTVDQALAKVKDRINKSAFIIRK